jgi:methionine aminopeptidase
MVIDSENDIKHLKTIGHICAMALQEMMSQAKPGMTTAELDNIGREFLEKRRRAVCANGYVSISRRYLYQCFARHCAWHP